MCPPHHAVEFRVIVAVTGMRPSAAKGLLVPHVGSSGAVGRGHLQRGALKEITCLWRCCQAALGALQGYVLFTTYSFDIGRTPMDKNIALQKHIYITHIFRHTQTQVNM